MNLAEHACAVGMEMEGFNARVSESKVLRLDSVGGTIDICYTMQVNVI